MNLNANGSKRFHLHPAFTCTLPSTTCALPSTYLHPAFNYLHPSFTYLRPSFTYLHPSFHLTAPFLHLPAPFLHIPADRVGAQYPKPTHNAPAVSDRALCHAALKAAPWSMEGADDGPRPGGGCVVAVGGADPPMILSEQCTCTCHRKH